MGTDDDEVAKWLAIRKREALKIDPETAEAFWEYGYVLDPYGIDQNLPEGECRQVGREYFARRPGSDIWVWFGDLPEKTQGRLWERFAHKLAITVRPDGSLAMNWHTGRLAEPEQ